MGITTKWSRGGRFVRRYSLKGMPYDAWEPFVPRIPDVYMEGTIYLYPSIPFAEKGEGMGGCGFLFEIPAATVPNAHHLIAVTNAHVIESGNTAIRVNTQDGKFDALDIDEREWIPHPNRDDLAIAPLPALDRSRFKYLTVSREHFLTKQRAIDLNLGPGDEVFVVGRFINSEGKQRNTPTLRFGNISQMPLEPIEQKRVWGTHLQESYLVEARAISGFSGSPVFTMLLSHFSRQGGKWPNDPERDIVAIMGVVWGYIKSWEPVCDERGNPLPSKMMVPSNTGMMGVVPSWKFLEMLDMPELKDRLKAAEDKYHEQNGPPATGLAVASPPTHRADFNRLLQAAVKPPKPSDQT